MKVLITGAAGFIGSRIARRMLAEGHDVVGVDAWRDYYALDQKRANVEDLLAHERFALEDLDLSAADLTSVVDGTAVVFHQAAQPGVRRSWGEFDTYVRDNVESTQRLLAACAGSPSLQRFVYASSSSVYGDAVSFPAREDALPAPRSPYGVTKLAAEHLVSLYADNFGVPTVSLRYFTVYGPGQRPDMALHRFINAVAAGEEVTVFGDGNQVRDFTYVADAVAATVAAIEADVAPVTVLNVAGGSPTTVADLLSLVSEQVGRPAILRHLPDQPGDVRVTSGATERARRLLGWRPEVPLDEGVKRQVAYQLGDGRPRARSSVRPGDARSGPRR